MKVIPHKKRFCSGFIFKWIPLMIILHIFLAAGSTYAQHRDEFKEIHIDKTITGVQPMTGIVFWRGSYTDTDAISLEFSYMLYNQVVSDSGVYNWDKVEQYLDDIASRGHQAVFRFRYTYVGKHTSVPDYIKNRPDYTETVGTSEGQTTWFPDWSCEELKRFTLEFYTKFAQRYDSDPRLAFLETGFGLWAEYHIYDGPFILGQTFPDIDFQEAFFRHMDTTFNETPFMVSIDAASIEADPPYTPFYQHPDLLDIDFGLFDDSFMHDTFGEPGEYNTESWNFFDRNRYLVAPAGGEFSYYSDYDQRHVLDYPDGPYGHPFEYFADQFHITFIIGADQPEYQTMQRIKEAGMAAGYKFKISSFLSKPDSSVVTVKNVGVAPFYYDAYVTVDGIRSPVSLKLLAPGDSIICPVSAGGDNPQLTITSDRLVEGQEIEFLGTENYLGTENRYEKTGAGFTVYPNPARANSTVSISVTGTEIKNIRMFSSSGQRLFSKKINGNNYSFKISGLKKGIYLLLAKGAKGRTTVKKLVIN